VPDERWARCDLKTICLLPNALAKGRAHRAGAFDALMIRDKLLTEGTASNVFLWLNEKLITPVADNRILHGITRGVVLKIAREIGYSIVERDINREELYAAQEVFLTSTSLELMPVVIIDDKTVGTGAAGDAHRDLHTAFRSFAQKH
jgi:D-alanine transaminase